MLPAPLKDQRRWVTPEALNVAQPLAGLALATPVRRALAMGVDLAFIALLSDVGGLWLVLGLLLVAALLRGPLAGKRKRVMIGWAFAGVLGLLALQDAWEAVGPDRAVHKREAAAERAAERAADIKAEMAEAGIEFDSDDAAPTAAASADAVGAATGASAASAAVITDAQRIHRLQREIAELRKPHPFKWREQLDRLIASVGISFGWGAVYFSLLPVWWNGQTLGKKLFRLRIVELTGKPLTVMRCLRRYGGYAAGMATGGLGFLQALWDVNRQGIQDRVAHTVVLDLRAPAREPPDATAEHEPTASPEISKVAETPDQAL